MNTRTEQKWCLLKMLPQLLVVPQHLTRPLWSVCSDWTPAPWTKSGKIIKIVIEFTTFSISSGSRTLMRTPTTLTIRPTSATGPWWITTPRSPSSLSTPWRLSWQACLTGKGEDWVNQMLISLYYARVPYMTGTVEFEGSLVPPLSGVKGNEAAYTILVPPKTSFFLNFGQVNL